MRRMDFDEIQYEQLVHAGIAAVKGGDNEQARTLLFKATEMKPTDPEPWLWLSATTDDVKEQRNYLEHAVAADPGNAAARRGLVLLSDKLDRSRLINEGEGVTPRRPDEPEQAVTARVFICPCCGGQLKFDPVRCILQCEHCGYSEIQESELAADSGEQLLDFVLPTTRGHRWAEAQHRLSCEQCGSIVLLPIGVQGGECPYCGSRRLIESAELSELIDPQAIALAQFDEKTAAKKVREWLGRGWFIPDDLRKLAVSSALRPAYYPFWTFDGTLELSWSCEVNQGSSRYQEWTMRNGVEYEMFDDVLVPGLRALSKIDRSILESFDLKKVVEFKPEHLAGWIALTYDVPLADASLKAREKVTRELRQQLSSRVELGSQKRNLQSGSTRWSDLTYKNILLPLWVGTYRYGNRRFRVLVNGQTGKVSGVKPNDPLKAFGFFASLTATIVALLLVLLFLAFQFGWLKPW